MARFNVPREFDEKNDDKWLKIFSKTSLLVFVVMFGASVLACRFAALFTEDLWPVIIAGGIATAVITDTTMISIPGESYMNGGGNTIAVILLRCYIRRKNRCLYVKGYNQWLLDTEPAYLVQKKLDNDDFMLRYSKREGAKE